MLAGRVWDHSVDKTMRTSKHKQKHFWTVLTKPPNSWNGIDVRLALNTFENMKTDFWWHFLCSQTWTRSLAKKACTSWRCLPCTVRPVFPYSAVCGHNLGSIDPNVRLDLFSWLVFFLNFCFSCAWMELNLASCYDFSPPGSTNMFFLNCAENLPNYFCHMFCFFIPVTCSYASWIR